MIVNDAHFEHEPCTVAVLLDYMKIQSRGIAVAVDGEVIPRSTWEHVIVRAGAVVEIVTAAAGG